MPRSYEPAEFNSFVAGFVTEATPLTFPPNASLDEENFQLINTGLRTRRNGFDYESGYIIIDSEQPFPTNQEIVFNSYKWENVGGDASRTFVVVQIQNRLHFFDAGANPISTALVGTLDYNLNPITRMSFASVDGKLVVVTGGKDIDVYTYDDTSFTVLSKRLLVRDLFGVTDIATSET